MGVASTAEGETREGQGLLAIFFIPEKLNRGKWFLLDEAPSCMDPAFSSAPCSQLYGLRGLCTFPTEDRELRSSSTLWQIFLFSKKERRGSKHKHGQGDLAIPQQGLYCPHKPSEGQTTPVGGIVSCSRLLLPVIQSFSSLRQHSTSPCYGLVHFSTFTSGCFSLRLYAVRTHF